MCLRFQKMQGLGNDFVVIDVRNQAFAYTLNFMVSLCDRRLGIGCDQLVLLEAPDLPGADVKVRFFNPDGSEAGACGNASRCVSKLLGGGPTLQTRAGLLSTFTTAEGLIGVRMGAPRLDWSEVPLAQPADTRALPLEGGPAACSMGNPHATFFDGIGHAVEKGPILEHDPIFPERANIGFVQVRARDDIRLRVWERGAGMTAACGSGACAAVVNGIRRGLLDRTCRVEMDGGSLTVSWPESAPGEPLASVVMIGPADLVFEGVWAATS